MPPVDTRQLIAAQLGALMLSNIEMDAAVQNLAAERERLVKENEALKAQAAAAAQTPAPEAPQA